MGPISLGTLEGRQREAGALAWIKNSQPSNLAQGWDQREPQFTFHFQREAPGKETAWEIPKSAGQGENKPRFSGSQSTGGAGVKGGGRSYLQAWSCSARPSPATAQRVWFPPWKVVALVAAAFLLLEGGARSWPADSPGLGPGKAQVILWGRAHRGHHVQERALAFV